MRLQRDPPPCAEARAQGGAGAEWQMDMCRVRCDLAVLTGSSGGAGAVSTRVLVGDAREVLKTLPSESVHMCVTSPPYYGLRDYGTADWSGGDVECDHLAPARGGRDPATSAKQLTSAGTLTYQYTALCAKCGATRIDKQMGLEATPAEWVEGMVGVFREVRRVLRPDGTLWLNIGDSYAGSGKGPSNSLQALAAQIGPSARNVGQLANGQAPTQWLPVPAGCKPKDLIGIPWMLAFALRADGWYLRADIIWNKPNPMPESVQDRPTKAHEYILLLSKSARYFYDADAIREGVGESGVIEGTHSDNQSLVLIQDRGLHKASVQGARIAVPTAGLDGRLFAVSVRLASSILDRAGLQNQFRLAPFDSQVRQKSTGDRSSTWAVSDPVIGRATAEATRFAHGDVSAKEFLRELYCISVALPQGDDFEELWAEAGISPAAAIELINANGDGTVAINHAGQVGQLQFIHNDSIPVQHPTSLAKPARKEPTRGERYGAARGANGRMPDRDGGFEMPAAGRNKRSVWTVATEAFPESHFATYPTALIEPCIKAGTSEKGCCPECGAPWMRVVEREPNPSKIFNVGEDLSGGAFNGRTANAQTSKGLHRNNGNAQGPPPVTVGWRPSCTHSEAPQPCTVLDPFFGAGTTGLVADRLNRNCIGVELNPAYAEMARRRIAGESPMFAEIEVA